VFAWGAATPTVIGTAANINTSAGWILQEFMPGVALAEPFAAPMLFEEKRGILSQMAVLLKGLQDYTLPGSVHGWGRVTFDENREVVSGPMVSVRGAGPWSSLEDEYTERIAVALDKADRNSIIKGWRENGI